MLRTKKMTLRIGTNIGAILVFIFFIGHASVNAQIDNYRISRATRGSIDTFAIESSQKVLKESEGIYEKEIDPEKYLMGPNDILTISIISARSREFDAVVSPEGKLLIPEAGVVNLKGKSLAEAEKIIKEKVNSVFRSQDVYILLKEPRKFKVVVSGFVGKPIIVYATALDRVSEVIDRAGGLKYDASLRYITLNRDDEKKVMNVDLLKYYMQGNKDANPTVLGGDRIVIPPVNEDLFIEVSGEVASPGRFEYVYGDSLSTLIDFAQGFLKTAYLDSVEIARFNDGSSFNRFYLDLGESNINETGNANPIINYLNNILLKPGDRVYVRKNSEWFTPQYVAIDGFVKYPGRYAIYKNDMRLSELLERAGGFLEEASPENSILIRKSSVTFDHELDRLRNVPVDEMTEVERRYYRSRMNEFQGSMSIDFESIKKNGNLNSDVELIDMDSVYVPAQKTFINVQGRVNKPGLVRYKPGLNYEDYIELAGGFGYNADKGSVMVYKSKGESFMADDNDMYVLEAGDNILVPPEEDITFKDVLTTTTQIITIVGVLLALSSAFK